LLHLLRDHGTEPFEPAEGVRDAGPWCKIEWKARRAMNPIQATWVNGHIVPQGLVNWPEGTKLIVEPISTGETIGMTEEEWDDPTSLAEWEEAVRNLEPPEYTEEELKEFARYDEEFRRFNLEAVRRQMESGENP
jgi:hypothetical protein